MSVEDKRTRNRKERVQTCDASSRSEGCTVCILGSGCKRSQSLDKTPGSSSSQGRKYVTLYSTWCEQRPIC